MQKTEEKRREKEGLKFSEETKKKLQKIRNKEPQRKDNKNIILKLFKS
jgi:hypothetical protein